MKTEIEKLVDEFGAYRLAQAVGVKHPSIHSWIRHGRVPAARVIAVEAATGVSRHRLRPDVFGPAPAALPAPANERDLLHARAAPHD